MPELARRWIAKIARLNDPFSTDLLDDRWLPVVERRAVVKSISEHTQRAIEVAIQSVQIVIGSRMRTAIPTGTGRRSVVAKPVQAQSDSQVTGITKQLATRFHGISRRIFRRTIRCNFRHLGTELRSKEDRPSDDPDETEDTHGPVVR